MRATIRDVAREAGVSKSTVSNVLRDEPFVRADIRARVRAAIARLSYRPNAAARSLVQRRAHAIGVVVSDIRNPFYAGISRAIAHRAREEGLATILADIDPRDPSGHETLETLLVGRVDGIVFAAWPGPVDPVDRLIRQRFPVVFVSCRPPGLAADFVLVDDEAGALLATEHLCALGHRRIAHIANPLRDSSAVDRLAGYRSGLRRCGLASREELVATAEPAAEDGYFGDSRGYAAAQGLLQVSAPPTAIFAADDFIALGAMQAVEEFGLQIPGDVSLVGFDNISVSGLSRIGLTTVDQPVDQMSRMASEMLLARIRGDAPATPVHRVLEPVLVTRASSGPAPGTAASVRPRAVRPMVANGPG